ncbi:rod-determining factor RdfA [Haladaptatus sp. SPP-AMP-3]|uniref:rod-determining factor RdfA n=1 Tax=Haladaptatus sp. SPP-AMP-3 TaxID=3121295 RepID=UPI003C2C96FA
MSESENDGGSSGKRGPDSKVARLIEQYELTGFGAELERRWTTTSAARSSLRDLADAFNRRLIAAALEAQNESVVDGEAANLYRLLTDDDVSSGARTKAVHEFRHAGVDADDLESDFVSHRAIHTYLTNHRGVSAPSGTEDEDLLDRRTQTLQRLNGRVERVTDRVLTQLIDADELVLDDTDAEIYVDVQVHCPTCNSQYSVVDLLSRGGCDCQ